MHWKRRLRHRKLRLFIWLGGLGLLLDVVLLAGLRGGWLSDIWFMVLAATAPWCFCMLLIGLTHTDE